MRPLLLLHAIGEALWGSRWQTDMAEALDVAPRTVRRWAAGDVPVPAGVWMDLLRLMQERAARLDDLTELAKGLDRSEP